MENSTPPNFQIENLGPCNIPTPYPTPHYVSDDEKVLYDAHYGVIKRYYEQGQNPPTFEIAGPRRQIFYDPSKVRAAIVTCGGLCPGLNDVIRSIVMQLSYKYKVRTIYGIRYGYQGLSPKYMHEPMMLTPEVVADIHELGGSILASSRGHQDVSGMVDNIESMNISMLFCIGGDGTLKGALAIGEEARRRHLKLSVVGLPKTIDNDILYIEKSFGFDTAFSKAADAVSSANAEAEGAPNGIGLVKLMGRQSGYIAANAALAFPDVNYVLIPEIPFELEGEKGLLRELQRRLERRRHAVIVVAEGAGQNLMAKHAEERDASGNVKLQDIGLYLKERITNYFEGIHLPISMKYIDPSYIIRSVPADSNDRAFCNSLGQNAVHAAMAGKTNLLIGRWSRTFTHVPIGQATSRRNFIDPNGELWRSVMEATGQPALIND